MSKDIVDLVDPYVSEDPSRWAKLASRIQYRRLHLLLLRAILIELRKWNQTADDKVTGGSGDKVMG